LGVCFKEKHIYKINMLSFDGGLSLGYFEPHVKELLKANMRGFDTINFYKQVEDTDIYQQELGVVF
jgi:hypothetical protein